MGAPYILPFNQILFTKGDKYDEFDARSLSAMAW